MLRGTSGTGERQESFVVDLNSAVTDRKHLGEKICSLGMHLKFSGHGPANWVRRVSRLGKGGAIQSHTKE